MLRTLILSLFSFFTLIIGTAAHAKIFKNSYISFQLPDRWECVLEDTEWVCRSTALDKNREAIIILTAKEVGPSDSLQGYQEYLRRPRVQVTASGTQTQSRVYQTKPVLISGQNWMDGLHLGSEIPNYFTRYLATIKDRIAILVTFSAHQRQYARYSKDFMDAIRSLKVVADRTALSSQGNAAGLGSGTGMIGSDPMIDSGDLPTEPGAGGPSTSQKPNNNFMWIGLLVIAAGIFIFIKKKKK